MERSEVYMKSCQASFTSIFVITRHSVSMLDNEPALPGDGSTTWHAATRNFLFSNMHHLSKPKKVKNESHVRYYKLQARCCEVKESGDCSLSISTKGGSGRLRSPVFLGSGGLFPLKRTETRMKTSAGSAICHSWWSRRARCLAQFQ